jgi:hypothetical protein
MSGASLHESMGVALAVLGVSTVVLIPLACVLCIVMEWGSEHTIRRVVLASYAVGGLLASVMVVAGLSRRC